MSKPQYVFSNRRTKCPLCGSHDGAAEIVEANRIDVRGQGFFKCHSCNESVTPYNKNRKAYNAIKLPDTANKPAKKSSKPDNETPTPDYKRLKQLYDYSIQHWYDNNLADGLYRLSGTPDISYHLHINSIGSDAMRNTAYWYKSIDNQPLFCKIIPYNLNCKRKKTDTGLYNDAAALYGLYSYCENSKGFIKDAFQDDVFNKQKTWKHSTRLEALSQSKGYDTAHLYNECFLADGFQAYNFYENRIVTYTNNTPVILVEAEKTAVLASYILPDYIWLATGGTSGLTKAKASYLQDRSVMIMFDNDDAGKDRAEKSIDMLNRAAIITPSDISNILGIDITNRKGFDLADYVVEQLALREYKDKKKSSAFKDLTIFNEFPHLKPFLTNDFNAV